MTTEKQQNEKRNPVTDFAAFMKGRESEFRKAVATGVDADKLLKVAFGAYSRTPKLWECSMQSVYNAIHQAASLGLEVMTPLQHAYIVPRWNKNAKANLAELMIGWRGYLVLIRRAGQVGAVVVDVVREKDVFQYERGAEKDVFVHRPYLGADAPGEIIAAYSKVVTNGLVDVHVMSRRDMDKRRAMAADNSDMWSKWEEEAYKKTVFRNHAKWLPMTTDDLERLAAVEGDGIDFDAYSDNSVGSDAPRLPETTGGTPSPTEAAKAAMAAQGQA